MNNKKSLHLLATVLALFTLLMFNACGDDDDDGPPANQITSATGATVSLTWLTGGTAAQALDDADLDLGIFDKDLIDDEDEPILFSASESSFESLIMSSALPDGDYFVKVLLYENFAGKAITFTVTASGGGKELKSDGNYAATDADFTIRSVMKISKAGNNYTVTNQ